MQTIWVQVVGLEVGSGDETHAIFKQRYQQTVQDHGIGNVGHMKLVKANELIALGHPPSQLLQRVDGSLHQSHLTVNFSHELMEVQTRFVLHRHRVVKTVHQKTLATTYTTKHVNTTR